jgi:hypothetical protein
MSNIHNDTDYSVSSTSANSSYSIGDISKNTSYSVQDPSSSLTYAITSIHNASQFLQFEQWYWNTQSISWNNINTVWRFNS